MKYAGVLILAALLGGCVVPGSYYAGDTTTYVPVPIVISRPRTVYVPTPVYVPRYYASPRYPVKGYYPNSGLRVR